MLSVTGFIEISVEPVSKNHLVLFTLFVSVIYRLFSITNFFINQSFLFMNNHTQFHIIKTNMSHSKKTRQYDIPVKSASKKMQ